MSKCSQCTVRRAGCFDYYFIFLRIFFGKRSEELPLDFLKVPFLFVFGFRLSLAGQPLFLLQDGVVAVEAMSKMTANMIREIFIVKTTIGMAGLCA